MNIFSENSNLYAVFQTNPLLIDVVSRFGITLGNGEQNLAEICKHTGVDFELFIVVINVYNSPAYLPKSELGNLSIKSVIAFLTQTHNHYRKVVFPNLELLVNKLCNSLERTEDKTEITKKFTDIKSNFLTHFLEEEQKVFRYAIDLKKGGKYNGNDALNQDEYFKEHEGNDVILQGFIKYLMRELPQEHDVKLGMELLSSLYSFEGDIKKHERIENLILTPMILQMEKKRMTNMNHILSSITLNESSPLSKREIDVIKLLAHGHTVKTLANALNISVHTATSHRKNISEKLGIKTIQGLTIYAFINGYVSGDAEGLQ